MSNRTNAAWLIVFFLTATALAGPPPGRAAATTARSEALLPLERQVREQFPSVALDSQATLEPAQELVAGQMVSGMRARPLRSAPSTHLPLQPLALSLPVDGDTGAGGALRVFYPASYNEAFVVELGHQRVALRAVGAHFAQAEASAGKLFYTTPHDSVDVIEVPSTGRSEELLLLRDARAPRIFEYEIVEMRGVASLSLQDGAIRFIPDHLAVPAVSEIVNGRFTAPQPSLQIDRPWVIDANGRRSESAAQWTILKENDQPRRIRLTIDSDPLSYPLVVDPSFSATGSMSSARRDHTATLLPNGKVLIAGGYNGSAYLSAAELYDPASGTFTATSAMSSARGDHTATLLPNGKVLIAGGTNGPLAAVNTAELYDPANGTFTATALMSSARVFHTATLLTNGKVLIAGGSPDGSAVVATAELYDPASGTFTTTSAPMTSAREFHTATLLTSGKVLIAGGSNGLVTVNTAELYDPVGGTFTATSPMTAARLAYTATLMPTGKVLIAGGINAQFTTLNSAELYDSVSGTFTVTSATMNSARDSHTATLLPNGKVLIAGGFNGAVAVNTADLYDPASGTFTATSAPMISVRRDHTATLLPNGKVLIAGGTDGSSFFATAELYDPASGTFTATGAPMNSFRAQHSATLQPGGNVLIAGGFNGAVSVNTADLYDSASGTFTATTGAMTSGRNLHTATLLPNGKVLLAGAISGPGVSTAELYDTGLGFSDARRPVVSSLTNPLCQPANLALSGSLFIGDSEGSSGSTNSSATNAPLLRLQRVDNDQLVFALPQIFSSSAFFSTTLSSLPSGRYRAAILSNAIPSTEQIFEVETTPLLGTYGAGSVALAGSLVVTPSSLPAGYNGAFYPLIATAPAGFTGTLSINGTSGVVSVANAGPTGIYTITVSASTSCGSPTTTFTLDVIGPPASVTASGGTPQSGPLNSSFASPLQATVRDSAGHLLNNLTVIFSAPASGASATLPGGGAAQTNSSGVASITATANAVLGSYNVTAVVGSLTATFALTNTNTAATPANTLATAVTPTSVSVSWTGTAGATYEVLRLAAGAVSTTLGTSITGSFTDNTASANTAYLYKVRGIAPSITPYGAADLATTVIFTDPTLVAGTTAVKAVHFTQMRTAVNAVRALAGLSGGAYTDPTLSPGVSVVKAAHLTDLRSALDAARSVLLLPAVIYTRPSIVAGTTTIAAADINDLRGGVR